MFAVKTLTIEVPDCPTSASPIPPVIDGTLIGWGVFLSAVLLVILIVAIGMVRYRAHERHEGVETAKVHAEAEIETTRLKNQKNCPTCGTNFPTVEKV